MKTNFLRYRASFVAPGRALEDRLTAQLGVGVAERRTLGLKTAVLLQQ